jgi:hypothetical protein
VFEKEPFGELERLVTQKLPDVARGVAREELRSEVWLWLMAQIGSRSYEQMRVDSWDIDLMTFGMEVVLNRRLTAGSVKRFEFAEQQPQQAFAVEPGLEQFLKDTPLSGDATEEEIEFLKAMKFKGKQPSRSYYCRELQNLRDPLHFPPVAQPGESV